MKKNPFIVAGKIPAEYFCDRQEEAAKFIKCIENQENILLISPRRVGKTGLMNFCFEKPEIAEEYIIIQLDILHTTSLREFIREFGNAVYRKVASSSKKLFKNFSLALKSLTASFGYDPIQGSPTFDIKIGDVVDPAYSLEEILGYLEKSEKRVIVAIDEFQQIIYYPEKNVEALLRGYIQQMSNVNFVFAGSERRIMSDMFHSDKHPFYQSATTIDLQPISLNIYRDWATNFFELDGKKVDSDVFDYVYGTFKGVTLYLQRIFHEAYADLNEGEILNVEMSQKLVENYVLENATRIREQLAQITEQQKELLYAIAEDGVATAITSSAYVKRHRLKSASSVQSAIKRLLDGDIVTKSERTYSLSDPLLQLWITKNK